MSIATVVTRGYGSFGSIAEVVTRGYSIGAAAQTDTRSGATALTPQELAVIARAIKLRRDQRDVNEWRRVQEELEELAKAKRKAAEKVAKVSPLAEPSELPPKPPAKTPGPKPAQYDFEASLRRIEALERSLKQTQAFMDEIEDREREEDEIETLLLMMH